MRKPAEPVDVPPPTVSGRFIREPHETVWRNADEIPPATDSELTHDDPAEPLSTDVQG